MNSNTGTSDLVITGIDPGLVHTGVVRIELLRDLRMIYVSSYAFPGLDPVPIRTWLDQFREYQGPVYVEAYRPRSHFNTDAAMVKAVNDFKSALPHAKVLDNTGVTKVVTNQMLRALELWRFTKATNHQDLRSAARIAILGMLKSEDTNKIVFQYMDAYLNETPWKVFRV